jgi:APA family basic amino acid/polyamine antiporter
MTQQTSGAGKIGYWGLLAMFIGLNIGVGLFVSLNIAGGLVGGGLPLAMLASAVPVIAALVVYRHMSAALPTTGATFYYQYLASPAVAFVTTTLLIIAATAGVLPLSALAAGLYLNALVPLHPLVVGVVTLTFFWLLNLVGVAPTAKVQAVLTLALAVALLLYLALGAGHVDAANFSISMGDSAVGALGAIALLMPLAAGGLYIIDFAQDVRDPKRTVPRVLAHGIAVVVVMYALFAAVTVGVVPGGEPWGDTLVDPAKAFMSDGFLVYFILGGAVVAAVTTVNALFTAASRVILRLASMGVLPAAAARRNERFGTPHVALTVCYAIAMACLLLAASVAFMAVVATLGIVITIAAVCWASRRLLVQGHPAVADVSNRRLVSGAALTATVLNLALGALLALAEPRGGITYVVLGVVIALVYGRFLRRPVGEAWREHHALRSYSNDGAQL